MIRLHSTAARRGRRGRWLRGIALGLTAAFLCSVLQFEARCAGIRGEVLRLHVIANSDSAEDQAAKLFVRDELLRAGADLFDGSIDAAGAEAAIAPRTGELEEIACKALARRGLAYPVRVEVGVDYFNTRTYEDVTLPAGRYRAVRVVLGAGGGQNWWCVMFPPLCLPAARPRCASLDAVLTGGQLRVVQSNPKYEIRFKLVELWQEFLERVRSRQDKPAL